MFEYIHGKIASLTATQAVIDCGGVGYLLEISITTYDKIQPLRDTNEPAHLLVHEVVREDAHLLYGFADEGERSLFRLLIGVSGVGANAIASQDEVAIKRIKGIGAKTAQRIVLELHDKVKTLGAVVSGNASAGPTSASKEEALAAMTMLGFAKAAVEKILATLDNRLTAEELIKEALKKM